METVCVRSTRLAHPGALEHGPSASKSFPLNREGGSKLSPVPPCRDICGDGEVLKAAMTCIRSVSPSTLYHGQQDLCKGNRHGRKASSRHTGLRGVRDLFDPIRGKQYFAHRCIFITHSSRGHSTYTSGRRGEMQQLCEFETRVDSHERSQRLKGWEAPHLDELIEQLFAAFARCAPAESRSGLSGRLTGTCQRHGSPERTCPLTAWRSFVTQ